MVIQGNLLKMSAVYIDPVQYSLHLSKQDIAINDYIGMPFSVGFLNQINCIRCGRKTSKSFGQGYCFPCFKSSPETEECVLRPELCRAHEGKARDMEYAKTHCLIDHFVYLAYTSGIKVGVTRNTQIPTRWIDQGAVCAVKLAKTPDRYTAGRIEVILKSYFNDKTNWRKMIKDDPDTYNIKEARMKAISHIPEEFKKYILTDFTEYIIRYPSIQKLKTIQSISLDKETTLNSILTGVKGQYLLFASGQVLNVRAHSGYLVEIKTGE